MAEYKVIVDEHARIRWRNADNQRHREDDPTIAYPNGNKCWYRNGKPHREDGPAVQHMNGDTWWYRNGELHREDGPAIEYANGKEAWCLNGQWLTEEKFLARTAKRS